MPQKHNQDAKKRLQAKRLQQEVEDRRLAAKRPSREVILTYAQSLELKRRQERRAQ